MLSYDIFLVKYNVSDYSLSIKYLKTKRSSSLNIFKANKSPTYGFDYKTPDQPCDLVCRLLNLHKVEHKKISRSSDAVVVLNASKLIQSRIVQGVSEENGLAFIRRWEAFKTGSNTSSQNASFFNACLTNLAILC